MLVKERTNTTYPSTPLKVVDFVTQISYVEFLKRSLRSKDFQIAQLKSNGRKSES